MKNIQDEVHQALQCSAIWENLNQGEQEEVLIQTVAFHTRPADCRYEFPHLARAFHQAGFLDRVLIE